MLYLGAKVGYWRGDIKGLVDDIGEPLTPACICMSCGCALSPIGQSVLSHWLRHAICLSSGSALGPIRPGSLSS